MECKDCNFYCAERKICVITNFFEFPEMPICNKFKPESDKTIFNYKARRGSEL